MLKPTSLVLLALLLVLQDVSCARILVVFPTVIKSHFVTVEPYMKALAARGHQLTVISFFPRKQPIPNYTDISLEGEVFGFKSGSGLTVGSLQSLSNPLVNAQVLINYGIHTCESVLNNPAVMKLIKSDEKYDAVIYDLFNTDCFLPIATKFEASSIGVSTSTLLPWANDRMGNPDNPAYVPNLFSHYSDRMDFFQRTLNAVTTTLFKFMYHYMADAVSQELVFKHFGKHTPDLADLVKNTSLVLVNSHFTLNSPRPLVPGVVEVGGMHIPPPQGLPQHLQEFLDGAEHGVIYFSLGTVIQGDTLHEEKRNAFLQAFAQLPQKVLWKWEKETIPGQPKNVRLEKWCPQLDILRHPNVVAFISHGGQLSSLEATYAGVPVVGVPFYGDHNTNLANLQARGMAVQLQYDSITKESVLEALKTVLFQPRFMDNARKTAGHFRDRPQPALDTAIFWTEYVIRHKGAPHLRSAAVDLAWYQYLLLDVIALMLAIVILFLLAVRKTFRLICGLGKKTSKKKVQ